jgi:hypothetical protein
MKLDYFRADINIPNLIGEEAANMAVQETVNDLILDYETEFLRLMLGTDLYDLYSVEIVKTTPDQKWTDLQDKIYNETTWRSPAAHYIFFKYLERQRSMLSGMGEVQATTENSTSAPMNHRMIRTWNRMSDMVEDIWEWIEDQGTDYDFSRYDTYTWDHNSRSHSPFEKINQWGI